MAAESSDNTFDLVDDEGPPKPRRQTVVTPPPPVDPNHPPVLAYASPTTGKGGKAEPVDVEKVKDLYLPLGLLAAGVAAQLLASLIWSFRHFGSDCLDLAFELTIGTAIMLGAMLLAAKLRGLQLGKIGVVAYKLAALSVAPAAIAMFLSPLIFFIPFGGWIIQFFLFFALLGAMFDLQEGDIWFCVWSIFIARLAFFFGLLAIHR